MSSTRRQMFEGVGAPVTVSAPRIEDSSIDPTMDSCCQREIESERKRSAVETALRAHDRVSRAEERRRQHERQPQSSAGGSYPNPHNLVHGMSFGSGCRCCYDLDGDGGEYELLAETRRRRADCAAGDVAASVRSNDSGSHDMERDDNGSGSDSGSDSDDEFDYLLDEELPGDPSSAHDGPQAQRRAELEDVARRREAAVHHGYGVHRQMHPRRAFAAVGYGSGRRDMARPRGAVLHLYDAHSPLSATLDLCLEEIAGRYAGTMFVRSVGAASVLFADDGGNARWKDANLPMLLAIRDGGVIAWCPGLCDFCDGSRAAKVEPMAVEQWLENAGVLLREIPPLDVLCRIPPEEEALLENMRQLNRSFGGMMAHMKGGGMRLDDEDIEEEEGGGRYDCGIASCNKNFYHEHVGVKNEAQDGLLVTESQVTSSMG